jgi:hypothetical protein
MTAGGSELLFPPRLIPQLRDLRGKVWQGLVDQVLSSESASQERAAFLLLMVRLAGCQSCHADSFRALSGCAQCASQSLRRSRLEDEQLLQRFSEARQDVEAFPGRQ